MPHQTQYHTSNPRQRLSILTNSTLGHDVSAAFKASSSSLASSRSSEREGEVRSVNVDDNEIRAPPPSPVDWSFDERSVERN
jgi:hypothetical protein